MIKLQIASENDSVLLHQLQKICFQALLEKYQDYDTNPGAESLERIRQRFTNEYMAWYLIQFHQHNIGMLRMYDYGENCRLSTTCILPEYRGRGFAKRAIMEVEKLYPSAAYWELDTILQETGLCKFYESLGFKQTGQIRPIKEGMDLVDYRKEI